MTTEVYEKELKAYGEDSRIACQYGVECYQKNPTHHTKYKHPPIKQQKDTKNEQDITNGRKRKSSECEDESSRVTNEARCKLIKNNDVCAEERAHSLSPSPSRDTDEIDSSDNDSVSSPEKDSSLVKDKAESNENYGGVADKTAKVMIKENDEEEKEKIDEKTANDDDVTISSSTEPERIIRNLFLTEMPDDFYKFYDFCKSLSSKDPCASLKLVDLRLVGPYDVLAGNIGNNCANDPEIYLRHWRYYYDPPEFQTIIKGNDKDGLHYGYWRDIIEDPPIFVARNSANKNCNIEPVAPNIFGAVHKHIGERTTRANPFEKGPMLKLAKQLKTFAKNNNINLDSENLEMRERARRVVAKTFHGAGIVVPYDKKTQIGYRDLSATDSQMKKILKKIDDADTDEERGKAIVSLEEIVRLATIAADESDFGTCLELGHDLFSSGIVHVQKTGLRMLASAYNLLNRKKFTNIAEAHAKDRKRGSDLGVL